MKKVLLLLLVMTAHIATAQINNGGGSSSSSSGTGPLSFNALTYGVTANTQVNQTASFNSASTTINCVTCNFTASDVGKIIFAVDGGTLRLAQTTIATFVSSTQVTSTAASSSQLINNGTSFLVWGTDDTAGLVAAEAAARATAPNCGTVLLPAGKMLVQSPVFNNASPTCSYSQNLYSNFGVRGQGKQVTFLVPTPNFNFTNCSGTGIISCFQGIPFGMYRRFAIWGAGYSPAGCSGSINLSANNGGFSEDQDHSSWCNSGSTSVGILITGATPGSYQGGVEAYGNTNIKVTAVSAQTINFVGYGSAVGLEVASPATGFISTNSFYNGTTTAVQVDNGTDWTSLDDLFSASANAPGITVNGTGVASLISPRNYQTPTAPYTVNGTGTLLVQGGIMTPVGGSAGGEWVAAAPTATVRDLGGNIYNGAIAGVTAPTIIQKNATSFGGASTALSLSVHTTTGSLLLVDCSWDFTAGQTVAVSDGVQTWTQLGSTLNSPSANGQIRAEAVFYSNNTIANASAETITCTITGAPAPTKTYVNAFEITNQWPTGSPFDVNVTNSGSGTSVTPGSTLSPTVASGLAFTFNSNNVSKTLATTSSLVLTQFGTGANFATVSFGPDYGNATYTLTGTYSGTTDWTGFWLTVRPAGSSTGLLAPTNVNKIGPVQVSSGPITIGTGTSISATSLCSTAQCPAGRYRVDVYINLTAACTTTGSYIPWLGYTDDAGAKAGSSTTTFFAAGGGLGVTPATSSAGLTLVPTSTTDYLVGSYFLNTTGAATGGLGSINYGTTAAACGTGGPMVGKMYLDVTRLE